MATASSIGWLRVIHRRWGSSAVALATALTASSAVAQPAPDPDPEPTERGYDGRGRDGDEEEEPEEQKITLPEPKNYVEPAYPPAAKEAGEEADVVLKLTIDEDGNVTNAEVHEGAGAGFDAAALEAAKGLKFSPARYANGNPFEARILYKFEFRIDDEVPDEPEVPEVGILRGKVLIRGVEAPLAGAEVVLRQQGSEDLYVTAGPDGSFDFGELEPGAYQLVIRAEGYDELALTETIVAGDELSATYRLNIEEVAGVIDVYVEGERPPREVTRRTIEKREIERIPGTNGDALRSLQSLPGVARPPGILGVLLVRGSAPQDSQIFVDGISVPIVYHFGGLSSVIPTELLDKIDFYPGNFSAKYGRAQGGIVDVGIRSPANEYHGLLQLDLIDARLLAEGPIPFTDKKWTFAVAGRRSWLDAWLGPVLEESGAGVTQAPRYYDYQAIVERKWGYDTNDFPSSGRGKFRVSFYGSDDALELLLDEPNPAEPALTGNIGLTTQFQRAQVGYDHQITEDDKLDIQLAFGRDAIGFGLSNLFFNLESLSFIGRAEYTRQLSPMAKLNVGIDMNVGQATVNARLPPIPAAGEPQGQPISTSNPQTVSVENGFYRPAAYLEAEVKPLDRWLMVPGVRLDYAKDTQQLDASPRFNTRFDVVHDFPRTTLKGGVGVFRQPPQFQQSLEPFGTAGLDSNYAVHYSLGVEQEITRQLEASLEGFYKDLDQQVVAENQATGNFTEFTNRAFGQVIGGELLVKYKPDDHFFGWVAYTLSRSERQNNEDDEPYLVPFDQTHILTVLGSYRFDGGWEVGAQFRLVSGNLVDVNVCDPNNPGCNPNRVNALFHGATGAYTPIQIGDSNSERLPLFHSLSLRVDKKWQFDAWAFSAYLDVRNAYNNRNVEGLDYNFNYTGRQTVAGIPILPSIGLRGEF